LLNSCGNILIILDYWNISNYLEHSQPTLFLGHSATCMADSGPSIIIMPPNDMAANAASRYDIDPELYRSSTTRVNYGGIINTYKLRTVHAHIRQWHDTTSVCVKLYAEMFYTCV